MHEWDIDRCRYVVYTWENGLLFYLCVCVWERERGASVTQQPSLLIRPSLARLHATHASTRTFWHPHPAPAHLKARTISSWIPISLLRFVFSQYLTHTHRERETRSTTHTHTHTPPSTQFIPIQGYTATTLACASLHPNMHNTSIFKEGIEQIEDGDHTALENAGSFGSRVMWRRLTDSSPHPLSLSCTKLPIPLSPAQNCQSLNPRDPSPLVHVFPALSSNMLSLLLPRIQNPDAHASHVYYMFASFSQT